MATYFLRKLFESGDLRDLRDLRDLICVSLDPTKKMDQFWGPSGTYMYGYLFKKQNKIK